MNKSKHSIYGFTLVEIMIVVAVIGMLATIAIPNFVSARNNARTSVCINNLRQIDAAKEQCALQKNLDDGAVYGVAFLKADLNNFIRNGFDSLACPSGGDYNNGVNDLGADPTCDSGVTTHVLAGSFALPGVAGPPVGGP